MGKHFGELAYIRGIITFKISQYHQRAFAGFSSGLPNLVRRMTENLPYVVPPSLIGYLIYSSTEKKFVEMNRKNPADYANDK